MQFQFSASHLRAHPLKTGTNVCKALYMRNLLIDDELVDKKTREVPCFFVEPITSDSLTAVLVPTQVPHPTLTKAQE